MNPKNFITYVIEIGIRFKNDLSSSEVDKIFRKLVEINDFDGIKKLSSEKGKEESSAILASSDESLALHLSNDQMYLLFRNRQLQNIVDDRYSAMNRIFKAAYNRTSDAPLDALRSTRILISTSSVDQEHIKSELLNTNHLNNLDSFDIGLEFDGGQINGKDTLLFVNASNEHTNELHEIFSKLEKTTQLKNLSVISSSRGMFEVDSESFNEFVNFATTDQLNKISLKKLGYGEKE